MYKSMNIERLDDSHVFYCGRLPECLVPDVVQFSEIWSLHPEQFHEILIHGKLVRTPRWQQAYGKDYHYTHRTNRALPIPSLLQPFVDWARTSIDARCDGVLVNWYEAHRRHYIGRHRDSTANMIAGAPIVTISLGQERVFRLRPWKGEGTRDFPTGNGTVFIMPYDTNLAWTHEVTHRAKDQGERISITLRAFC
jgi:alkylated DNA repair dioxygenase AlkB